MGGVLSGYHEGKLTKNGGRAILEKRMWLHTKYPGFNMPSNYILKQVGAGVGVC
jgi:hypothetical protein